MLALLITANIVAILLGLVIPVATETVTRCAASPTVKRAVTIVIAAFAVLISSNIADSGTAIISGQNFFDWALATAIATLSYLGVWKPAGLKGAILPQAGLG